MKKLYLLFALFSVAFTASSLSFQDNRVLNDSMFSTYALSFNQISIEQKVNRILNAEADIYKLPFTKEEIRNQIIPEINSERLILAPNYPQTVNVFGEEKRSLLRDWINNFPAEYDNYIAYIENYIRTK